MNEREKQRLIDRYLARLDRELDDVPADARRELLEDVRSHIEEAWAAAPEQDRAALERILARLGPPEALARDERERLGLPAPVERNLGLLGWAAIVLTALFTPVGLILAWISTHWRTRDKAIATGIALAGLVLVLAVTLPRPALRVSTTGLAQTVEAIPTSPEARGHIGATSTAGINSASPLPVALVLVGLWGAPLGAATYLALRVRRPARRPLLLVPVAAAAVLFLACSLIILLPLATNTLTGGQRAPVPERTLQVAP